MEIVTETERCDCGTMLAVELFSTPLSSSLCAGSRRETRAVFTLMQIKVKRQFTFLVQCFPLTLKGLIQFNKRCVFM